ncbi:MAG: ABC transporter permease subunit [ANME-2 cluster archaeon]|jgi:peptide/nickel transport system permease protein|nr:ABC transporter permease subunit [ANME-2 cluster archaeon]
MKWNRKVKMVTVYLFTIIFLVFLNFLLPRLLPGDAILAMYSGSEILVTEELYNELIKLHGLDRPLHEQFITYLIQLAHGDLGYSYMYHASTTDLIMGALPWTMLLICTSFILSAVVGIILGVESAWRRGRKIDRWLLTSMLLIDGVPSLVIGIIFLTVFGLYFEWFPSAGAITPYSNAQGITHISDVLMHLVLPLATLTLSQIPGDYLLIRNSMVLTIREPFILTARAKGLKERKIRYCHAARNAILPFFTRIGVRIAFVITGVLFIETIFAYPGLGLLTYKAISNQDLPLIQGILTVSVLIVLLTNILVDIFYKKIDPRIEYAF